MQLYVYDHCPYCVKARMIFGLKNLPFEMVMVLNDDVDTPTRLIGQKMVPILVRDDAVAMPESMDIVRYIDGTFGKRLLVAPPNSAFAEWIAGTKAYLSLLTYPRWVAAPLGEFATQGAREYFTHKKERSIGAFAEALAQSERWIGEANVHLQTLAPLLHSAASANATLGEDDIHLFAVLRSHSIVKGLRYPPAVEAYRHAMATRSHVPLHDNLAL